MNNLKKKTLVKILVVVLLAIALTGCTTRIGPGMVGIEVDQSGSQRGVKDYPLKTGRVWYNPWSTTIYEYPTYMQTVVWTANPKEGHPNDESITFTIQNDMAVNADFNLSYTLVEDKVPEFYVKFRSDDLEKFTDGFMHNVARDCVNGVAGHYDIDRIMGDNAEFIASARKCLQDTLLPYGVKLEQFGIIGAPRPPDSIKESINMKAQATQLAIQKQNEVAQATADAQKAVAVANGEANAMIARAKGEAEANRIKSSSIDDKLVRWYQLTNQHDLIWRWDGKRPAVEAGSGGLILQMPAPKD